MLDLLWKLMEDDADAEAKALAEMLRQHPEPPEAGADFLQRLAGGELPKNAIQQLLGTHPPLSERITELRAHTQRLRPLDEPEAPATANPMPSLALPARPARTAQRLTRADP